MSTQKKFSEIAWKRNLSLYERTPKMPFNEELCLGTLSKQKFRYYIIQDTKYLEKYARVFALAAAKSKSPNEMAYLIKNVQGILDHEQSIHGCYLKEYGVSKEEFDETEASPSCHHYTSFLLSVGYNDSLPVIFAALLPCFWIYNEVGKSIKSNSAPNNPFHRWIEQYGSEEFDKSTKTFIDLIDNMAKDESEETINRMLEVYTYSARLEFMFWESAYRLEKWTQ
ncbi:Aminopyrimidine aminohydrolase [Aphelenchoides bicaudatus]|nr:Aminopyrimidine aminohydrolase [Aphelenchoides bicaudatus]